ncbi:MAG: ATP-binding protein [Bacteriovoracaceae bacterium]|nr:ATP-binding protein [Bacteriovoracaceae bacterium]
MPEKEIIEDTVPKPQDLIKSIAEQGYSLESALADLIDNSITAGADKVEILLDTEHQPFTLFLADNGNGMTEETLRQSMQFPSSSLDSLRNSSDLGRFGLGLKTASFSQTRKFTVLSKVESEPKFSARTWDVELLKDNKWKILVNSDAQVQEFVGKYNSLSREFLNAHDDFQPNTIIIWSGLYKFEEYLQGERPETALKKELTEVTSEHLEMVFHRFMEDETRRLKIRINNTQLKPFNPFPADEPGFRPIAPKQKSYGQGPFKMEGFVIPARAIDEVKNGQTNWTTRNKGLMDMEGVYIYRLNRIILYGGWNGLIRKAPRLQLARLRIEIGNTSDHWLHLNVAKSQVIIPHDLKKGVKEYTEHLKKEAEREYFNRGIKVFPDKKSSDKAQIFTKRASNKGTILELNNQFPLIEHLQNELSPSQLSKFKSLLRIFNTTINGIRKSHEVERFSGSIQDDGLSINDILTVVRDLKANGVGDSFIKEQILPKLGFELASLPKEIMEELGS